MGVIPRALSRTSSVRLGARIHRGEALSSTSSPHQKPRRSCFARAPSRSHFGGSCLRELRLALVSRLGSSKSCLRLPFFEAYRKIARISFSRLSGTARPSGTFEVLGQPGPRALPSSLQTSHAPALCGKKSKKYISSSQCETAKFEIKISSHRKFEHK